MGTDITNEIKGAIQGSIPNLMLICYQAVENELCRKQDWLNKKIKEMSKQRFDAMKKAKDYLMNKDLMLAFASAKTALMEDQKIGTLTSIKEKLANNLKNLTAERKKEESQPMSIDKLKEQISVSQLEKLKELIEKWVSDFEDMIPIGSISLIDEIAKDLKGNPIELFKKLKDITELGDFDEEVIDTTSNPLVTALNIARELISKKDNEIDAKIEEYQAQKQKCIDQAKENVTSNNYLNALMMLKTLPIFETKIQCGSKIKKALNKGIEELDTELKETKGKKGNLDELKNLFSGDKLSVMSNVISKWLSKQSKIVSDLLPSPSEFLSSLSSPISMNPMEIIKELNGSGLLPKIDIESIVKGDALKVVGDLAGSLLGQFQS